MYYLPASLFLVDELISFGAQREKKKERENEGDGRLFAYSRMSGTRNYTTGSSESYAGRGSSQASKLLRFEGGEGRRGGTEEDDKIRSLGNTTKACFGI